MDNLDYKARDLASTEFELRDYKLFVNVAPEELHNPLFSEDIELHNVVLEITEESKESPFNDSNRLKKKLEKLRDNGLEIALDDFGTQRQNYDRLPQYKPDFVKLDNSIVTNVEMLKLFVPHIPQYNVIVEGVETAEQLQNCIDLGFHYVQGFYLAHPLPYTKLMTSLLNKDLQNSVLQKLDLKVHETS